MVQRRNLSVGITVNLENYENLRLEVSGEVGEGQNADDLIAYLDEILSRLGRGTPETAEKVDSYRRRVLALPPGAPLQSPMSAIQAPSPVKKPAPATPPVTAVPVAPAAGIQESAGPSPASVGEKKETVPPVKREIAIPSPVKKEMPPLPMPGPAKKAPSPPAPEPKKEIPPAPPVIKREIPPPAPVKKETAAPAAPGRAAPPAQMSPSPDIFSCERCGEPITPVQRKLSRLFQNKDLCKKCLNQV